MLYDVINNDTRVYCIGEYNLIPGQSCEVDIREEYLNNPDLLAAKEAGLLIMNAVTEKTDDLSGMTVAQLKQYAAEKGIDLGDASKKEEILAVLAQD